MSKSKLAPINKKSKLIPQQELQAALIALRLRQRISYQGRLYTSLHFANQGIICKYIRLKSGLVTSTLVVENAIF